MDGGGQPKGKPLLLPSVTHILKALPKDGLDWYGYKLGIEAIRQMMEQGLVKVPTQGQAAPATDDLYEQAKTLGRKQNGMKVVTPYNNLMKAAARGTDIHDIAEKLRKTMCATDPAKAEDGTIRKQFGAGIERNATVAVPLNQSAVVLEVTRPALRLLRKLPKFGQILDETYRKHGFARVLEDLTSITGKSLSGPLAEELRLKARYMVYGKNHELCKEGDPIDRVILIKTGWVRRSRGVPFHGVTVCVIRPKFGPFGCEILGSLGRISE